MKIQYIIYGLTFTGASAHPSKRQSDLADGVSYDPPDAWNLPTEDWSEYLQDRSVADSPPYEGLPPHNAGDSRRLFEKRSPDTRNDNPDSHTELDGSSTSGHLKQYGTDLSVRQDQVEWARYLSTALVVSSAGERIKSFHDLAKSCNNWAGGEGDSAGDCIFGAVTTLLYFAGAAYETHRLWIILNQRLAENGMALPYMAAAAAQIGPVVDKRGTLLQVENLLSRALGSDVRYIGDWKRSRSSIHSRRSGEEEQSAVFGLEIAGVPMHMAQVPDENNATKIVLGHGPGPGTNLNKRRLRGRSSQTYNDQYFDDDGLAMVSLTNPDGGNSPEVFANPENRDNYEHLFNEVKCYMTDPHAMYTMNGIVTGPSIMEMKALRFQTYNYYDEHTLCAGEIAPLDDGIVQIENMEIETGLRVNPKCSKRH